MRLLLIASLCTLFVALSYAEEVSEDEENQNILSRQKRDYGGYGGGGGYGGKSYGHGQTYHHYEHKGYSKKILCYQCSWGPPKRYKVKYHYKEQGYDKYGKHGQYGHGYLNELGSDAGYTPCKGPFSHYQAQAAGLDVWACHSLCYTRKDRNGHIFRGCFKGEYGVNPYKLGCHYQGGSTYCFCKGNKCNNGAAPYH